MTKIEKIKACASLHSLFAVDFLDSNGRYATKSKLPYKKVRLLFSDGSEFFCTPKEFEAELSDFKFNIKGNAES